MAYEKLNLLLLLNIVTTVCGTEETLKEESLQERIDNFIAKKENEYLKKIKKKKKELSTIKCKNEEVDPEKSSSISIAFCNDFLVSLQEIKGNITKENENAKFTEEIPENNFYITAQKGIMFASDIHSDADSLKRIWFLFEILKTAGKVDKLVFLGDYGDRGDYWLYTYFLLAAMANYYKEGNNIVFVRGNHEEEDQFSQYNKENKCFYKEKDEETETTKKLEQIWEEMLLMGTIKLGEKTIYCSHGNMPFCGKGKFIERQEVHNIFYSSYYYPANWNDCSFQYNDDIKYSGRGAGYKIGLKLIEEEMKKRKINICVHGHCHQNNYAYVGEKADMAVATVISNNSYYHTKYPTEHPLGAVFLVTKEENKYIRTNPNKKEENGQLKNNHLEFKPEKAEISKEVEDNHMFDEINKLLTELKETTPIKNIKEILNTKLSKEEKEDDEENNCCQEVCGYC